MTYEEALYRFIDFAHSQGVTTAIHEKMIATIKEALEKQIPKKPIDNHHCPSCETGLPHKGITDKWCRCCFEPNYCSNCGQRLNWSE